MTNLVYLLTVSVKYIDMIEVTLTINVPNLSIRLCYIKLVYSKQKNTICL